MTDTAHHSSTNNKIIIIIIFIIIVIIIRHSVLFLFNTHSFLALSPHSVTVTYTSSSPLLFFPFVAGGFPAATGVWGKRNVRSHRRRYAIF